MCGFKGFLDRTLVGVEAAHIKWHQAGGPDSHPNGIALCALHHKLFDRGMITFSPAGTIVVSECAHGSAMFAHLVSDFHGRMVSIPHRDEYRPAEDYLAWHVSEVFHPPARQSITA